MGEAIETTQQLYPGLLESDSNTNLLFMLKCRQFIEMVNGTDSEVRGAALRSPRSQHGGSNRSSPSRSPIHYTHSPRVAALGSQAPYSGNTSPNRSKTLKSHSNFQPYPQTSNSNSSNAAPNSTSATSNSSVNSSNNANSQADLKTINEENLNAANTANSNANSCVMNGSDSRLIEDVEMLDGVVPEGNNSVVTNGNSANGQYLNGSSSEDHQDEDMGKIRAALCLYLSKTLSLFKSLMADLPSLLHYVKESTF